MNLSFKFLIFNCITTTSVVNLCMSNSTKLRNRAFTVVGPQTWNDLPDDVTSTESLSTFH